MNVVDLKRGDAQQKWDDRRADKKKRPHEKCDQKQRHDEKKKHHKKCHHKHGHKRPAVA